jgi:NADPH-dependent 2,4-dienoyl-CoA reductase/sulfur reductase-like enzyme
MPNHTAESIDPERKTVSMRRLDGTKVELSYDKLLIGTGARPIRPAMEGLELPGVFPLHTMGDSFAVRHYLEERQPKSAAIIGAGYIGLEMADALVHRGIHVTLASRTETILPTVDPDFGRRVEMEMQRHGVDVCNRVEVRSIRHEGNKLIVAGTQSFLASVDLVLVAVGVQPNSELGVAAGIPAGVKGALKVNRRMETNLRDVYAAGDCAETWHRLLKRYRYMPLGTTSHKQGRVAGENAIGGSREFAGSLGTQVVKLFDLIAARTGLRDHEAKAGGMSPLTVESTSWDHNFYYPNARELTVRITGDQNTGKLLGAQLLGHKGSEVSKRVDIIATALFQDITVEALNDLDLSYTPPLSSPWDPVQMGAQSWSKATNNTIVTVRA